MWPKIVNEISGSFGVKFRFPVSTPIFPSVTEYHFKIAMQFSRAFFCITQVATHHQTMNAIVSLCIHCDFFEAEIVCVHQLLRERLPL